LKKTPLRLTSRKELEPTVTETIVAPKTCEGDGCFFAAGERVATTRELRALALYLGRGSEIEQYGEDLFYVPSQDGSKMFASSTATATSSVAVRITTTIRSVPASTSWRLAYSSPKSGAGGGKPLSPPLRRPSVACFPVWLVVASVGGGLIVFGLTLRFCIRSRER
jgi:hypothetical protein